MPTPPPPPPSSIVATTTWVRLWKLLNTASQPQSIRVFNYDAQGNLTKTIDSPDGVIANDQTTDYSGYDNLNRLTEITDAIGGLTHTNYDGLDHVNQVKDPRNLTTDYVTSGLDNRLSEDSPDRGAINNTSFDAAGNLLTSSDARGIITTYSYDSLNRLLSANYQPPTGAAAQINYRYDGNPNPANNNAKGKLTHIDVPSDSTDWNYDSEGRLQSKLQTTDVTNAAGTAGTLQRNTSYSYVAATGRLDILTYPSGLRIKYSYDSAGRPRSIALAANAGAAFVTQLDTIAYRPLGVADSYRLPAVTGQPTISRHTNKDGNIDSYTLNDGGKILSYDRLGNLIRQSDGDPGNTINDLIYQYDSLNRLTDFSRAAGNINQHYDYDAGGNRRSKTVNTSTVTAYTPETDSNRLATVGSAAYNYDLSGNLTSNGAIVFVYSARGRLSQVKTTDNSLNYKYATNGLGQRVSKTNAAAVGTAAGASRVYVYDEAGHLIGEYDSSGARIQEHIWLGDQPVVVVNGSGGGLFYVLSDHLNTPRQIINSSKQLRWRWDNLDPFGVNLPDSNPQGLGGFAYALRFPGQYYDSESGLFYNGFRSYDPKGGRYTQSDPIGLMGGLNTYSYVGNNPLNAIDPLGLDEFRLYSWGMGFRVSGQYLEGGTIIGGPLDPLALAEYGVEIGATLSSGEIIAAKYLAGVIRYCPSPVKGGAARAATYASGWEKASLNDAVTNFAGLNPVVTTTAKGKRIYTNTRTGIQVVEDTSGNYFRIYDPSIQGEKSISRYERKHS